MYGDERVKLDQNLGDRPSERLTCWKKKREEGEEEDKFEGIRKKERISGGKG